MRKDEPDLWPTNFFFSTLYYICLYVNQIQSIYKTCRNMSLCIVVRAGDMQVIFCFFMNAASYFPSHEPHVSLTDEDECLTGRHRCSHHARCVNAHGSYTCRCVTGYAGDGFSCLKRKSGSSQNGMYFQYKLSKRSRTTDTGRWKKQGESLQLCSLWQERCVKRVHCVLLVFVFSSVS